MITITELAAHVGVSVFTIQRWYRYQRKSKISILPTPQKIGVNNYYKESDIQIFKNFKNKIIKGRNGVMSNVK